jgi:amino acid transporter
LQAAITVALVVLFGLLTRGAFESMVEFTAAIFWTFFVLVGVALFVLRWREPRRPRPYRVIGYPVTPLIFLATGLFMLYASLSYALQFSSYEPLWAVGLVGIGVVLSLRDWRGAPVVVANDSQDK